MRKVITMAAVILAMMMGSIIDAVAAPDPPPLVERCSIPIGTPMAPLFIPVATIFIPTILDSYLGDHAQENGGLGYRSSTLNCD